MDLMKKMERDLGAIFAPKKVARGSKDPSRRAREKAKKIATMHGIEIEKFPDGGMNVWAPESLGGVEDPFDGDHYAGSWEEALGMVEEYAKLLATAESAASDE